jgi:putative MATE family efflux protein
MTATARGRVGSNLTEGPILRTLLTFAIPIVLTNLVQQLYSMVDLIVIGQFVGSVGTVGVNTGGEIMDMLTPVAVGFSTAGQIYIAQLVGAGDEINVKRAVGTLLTFMLGLSVIISVVVIGMSDLILGWLNCPMEAWGQAKLYMIITALGNPFVFGYNAVCGVLRGMGESKRPLLFIIVAAIVNIVLDLLLVTAIPLEAAGTAIATAGSQLGAFAAAFCFMWKKREKFDFELKLSYFKIDPHILGVLVKLGIPQVARSLLVRTGMLWVNASANSYGLVVSATNSVGNKLQKFMELFIQGIDTAAAAMIGQNLGAKKTERAGKITLYTTACALVCAVGSGILCWLIPKEIFGLFTKDPAVQELGIVYLHIMTVHFIISAITGSFQAMVTGSGFVTLGFALGTLDGLICKIGLSLLFVNVFGMDYLGLFWGVALSRALPALINIAYFVSGKWKTRKLLTEK